MNKLVEVTADKHGDWKVRPNCALDIVAKQHVLSLKVSEVGKAATAFPVFFNKIADTREWVISGMMSLEPNTNSFIVDGFWDAQYEPIALQTYPFYLMKSPADDKSFCVGIDEANDAFSQTDGEPLFANDLTASPYLSQITTLLEDDLKNDVLTFRFTKQLEELGLLKALDLKVHYQDSTVNSLNGLFTVDEKKFQTLPIKDLEGLRDKGYLAPIYAMLISIFQLNGLVRRYNQRHSGKKINQVSIGMGEDSNAS